MGTLPRPRSQDSELHGVRSRARRLPAQASKPSRAPQMTQVAPRRPALHRALDRGAPWRQSRCATGPRKRIQHASEARKPRAREERTARPIHADRSLRSNVLDPRRATGGARSRGPSPGCNRSDRQIWYSNKVLMFSSFLPRRDPNTWSSEAGGAPPSGFWIPAAAAMSDTKRTAQRYFAPGVTSAGKKNPDTPVNCSPADIWSHTPVAAFFARSPLPPTRLSTIGRISD